MSTIDVNYWINTVSRDHVNAGIEGGFTQANHGSPRNLQRMARGDLLVFYSPKTNFKNGEQLQKFTAIGRITDNSPFQVEVSKDFKPYRRKVDFFECKGAPIHPMLDQLTFVTDKTRWGFPFRRGLFKVSKEDFTKIAQAMGVDQNQLE